MVECETIERHQTIQWCLCADAGDGSRARHNRNRLRLRTPVGSVAFEIDELPTAGSICAPTRVVTRCTQSRETTHITEHIYTRTSQRSQSLDHPRCFMTIHTHVSRAIDSSERFMPIDLHRTSYVVGGPMTAMTKPNTLAPSLSLRVYK